MTIFGPNKIGEYYKPSPKHSRKAKKGKHNTCWLCDKKHEYELFLRASDYYMSPVVYVGNADECRWINDNHKGLYSFDPGFLELSNEGHRLAYFPLPSNPTDPWHGYPCDSTYIGDGLIQYWLDKNLISAMAYRRLMKHLI